MTITVKLKYMVSHNPCLARSAAISENTGHSVFMIYLHIHFYKLAFAALLGALVDINLVFYLIKNKTIIKFVHRFITLVLISVTYKHAHTHT